MPELPQGEDMKSMTKCLLISFMALGLISPLAAEDLSDNETCMECHADVERAAPEDASMPQVHNPEGGFFAEAHEMWSCIDCHTNVTELPHADDFVSEPVDCLGCHEETPTN
jgi:hypothetical protein